MAKFRKIFPALCMLLVSAVLLGGTTFAWFSMNKQVKAEGLGVTAQSKTTYLMIGKTDSADAYDTSVSFSTDSNKSIYPCAYTATAITVSGDTKVEAESWYAASSQDYDQSNTNVTNYQSVTVEENNYFLKKTVYLKLSPDSEAQTSDVKLTFARAADTHEAVKAVVKVGSTVYQFGGDNTVTVQDVALSTETAVAVEIYVYIDGTHADVNSEWFNTAANAGKLSGKINVTFDLV